MQAGVQAESLRRTALKPEHLLVLRGRQEQAEAVLGLQLFLSSHDPGTRVHCENLSRYGVAIASSLKLPQAEIEALRIGGMVHDVGKIAIPTYILNKRSALTLEERLIVEAHPVVGERMCAGIAGLRAALPIIRHHHERFDGSGYPDCLIGEGIPLAARIVHIVDVFDAMTSPRPYKPAWSAEHALGAMQQETERGWLDPRLFRQFARLVRRPEAAAFATLR